MSDYHDANGNPGSLDKLCRDEPQWAASQIARLCEQVASVEDKALRFDLDRAGIERREIEATELVDARAEIARLCKRVDVLEHERDEWKSVAAGRGQAHVEALRERDEAQAELAKSVPIERVREVLLLSLIDIDEMTHLRKDWLYCHFLERCGINLDAKCEKKGNNTENESVEDEIERARRLT